MDECKSEQGKPPNLRSAMRRARAESAEQHEALADLRQAEVARLELLEDAIRPIVDQAPDDVELFDLGVTHGDRPRLFLDMISFVDLAHDRRTFRFFQDTRHGRVLIAESDSADRIVAAVTNYVARRLVEREQALAADWRSRSAASEHIRAERRPIAARDARRTARRRRRRRAAAPRRRFWRVAGDVVRLRADDAGLDHALRRPVPRRAGRLGGVGPRVLGGASGPRAVLTRRD